MECVSQVKANYPRLSVIIPIYKVEHFIGICARSLFEQTLKNIEYVFVDDNSPDASVKVLQGIINEYPNRKDDVIIISNEQNLGPSFSRNVGLERSSGEYVAFCDSDDELESNAYELLLTEAIEKDADIVSCGVFIDENGKSEERCFEDNHFLSHDSLYRFDNVEGLLWSSSCNKLFRRSFLSQHEIKFHPTLKMWDDLYFTFTARFFCKVDAIVNLPLYHYKIKKEGSLTTERVSVKVISQIDCVRRLELFLESHGATDMGTTLSFLKLRSKDLIFNIENKERWRSIYPESHKGMYRYLSFYGLKRVILFYLYANSNIAFVSRILECYSKFRTSK